MVGYAHTLRAVRRNPAHPESLPGASGDDPASASPPDAWNRNESGM
jgi:hypothetical protein